VLYQRFDSACPAPRRPRTGVQMNSGRVCEVSCNARRVSFYVDLFLGRVQAVAALLALCGRGVAEPLEWRPRCFWRSATSCGTTAALAARSHREPWGTIRGFDSRRLHYTGITCREAVELEAERALRAGDIAASLRWQRIAARLPTPSEARDAPAPGRAASASGPNVCPAGPDGADRR
jgi:hypothetical protein